MQIALYTGTRPGLQGIYSRGVRRIDRGPYSHGELIFSDGASASSSFIDGGVRFKCIEYSKPGNWDFLNIPDPTGLIEIRARHWFTVHDGQEYDLWGNVRFVFGWVRDCPDQWSCLEAIMAALGFAEAYRFGPNGAAALLRMQWSQEVLV